MPPCVNRMTLGRVPTSARSPWRSSIRVRTLLRHLIINDWGLRERLGSCMPPLQEIKAWAPRIPKTPARCSHSCQLMQHLRKCRHKRTRSASLHAPGKSITRKLSLPPPSAPRGFLSSSGSTRRTSLRSTPCTDPPGSPACRPSGTAGTRWAPSRRAARHRTGSRAAPPWARPRG